MKASALLTILTSTSASLCCIVPVFGVVGGSSSLMSGISWLETLRPYFIGGTFLLLGFAWYSSMKASRADDCGCKPEKRSFLQSKKFLSMVTILSLILISFPSFSRFIIQSDSNVAAVIDQERPKTITLSVNGMTCSSCEHHIESEVFKLSGVSSVKASYATKSATIEFNPGTIDQQKIIAAINKTGYTVNENVSLMQEKPKTDCCTKGTCTPEACSTMPKLDVPKPSPK